MLIDWISTELQSEERACPACQAVGRQALVLRVPNFRETLGILTFSRCSFCDSLNASGKLFEYTDDVSDNKFWKHYAHVDAGIDSMVRPLERMTAPGISASLLDVGCGFGFTLDYWRRMNGGAAVGVEPSEFGRMGREELGVDIRLSYLQDDISLQSRQFDLVYSSEVIEHVPDPSAFLASLRLYMAEGAALALTTPNADFVQPGATPHMAVAALSPGFHKVLFSENALGNLLRKVGFAHVIVESQTERLVAFASDRPLRLRTPDNSLTKKYIAYLRDRADALDLSQDLQIGFCFRAYKELVNAAAIGDAQRYAERFRDCVLDKYGFDAFDPKVVSGVLSSITGPDEYVTRVPFCFGPLLFYRAMAAAQDPIERAGAEASFTLATRALARDLILPQAFYQEAASLYWIAEMERGCAALRTERRREAIDIFDRILSGPPTDKVDGAAFPTPSAETLVRTRFERAVAYLQLGETLEAMRGFVAVLAEPATAPALRQHAARLLDETETDVRGRLDTAIRHLRAALDQAEDANRRTQAALAEARRTIQRYENNVPNRLTARLRQLLRLKSA